MVKLDDEKIKWLIKWKQHGKKMTAEKSAFRKFQDEPFFEVLIQSVARKATEYAYAKIKHAKTLGAGNTVDCIIREETFKKIEKLEKSEQS